MSTVPSVAALKAEAESLGLTVGGIANYVFEQQKVARDERSSIRELERVRLENDENDRAMLHELALVQANVTATVDTNPEDSASNRPRLPVLRNGDDVTSFFIRFERVAAMLNIQRTSFAVRIGSLLSGKAVDIFASLSPEITASYDRLKSALLNAFNKTQDGYRFEFKNAKVSPSETYEQFTSQLTRKLEFWLSSCDVDCSYEGLKVFLLKDEFLSSVSPEIRLYIKERSPSNLSEMVNLADNWSTARRKYYAPNNTWKLDQPSNRNYAQNNERTNNNYTDLFSRTQKVSQQRISDRNFSTCGKNRSHNVTCYQCGKRGH